MNTRRILLVAAAAGIAAVAAAACSGESGGGRTLSTGEFIVSSHAAGTNDCHLSSLDDGTFVEGYVSMTSAQLAGASGSLTGATFTLTATGTDDLRPKAALFCRLSYTATLEGTITGHDEVDVTLTRTEADPVGHDCAFFAAQTGTTFPCTTTETFHLAKTGPANPPAPRPTPPAITGSLSGLDSGDAPFVSYTNSTGMGMGLSYTANLGAVDASQTSAGWFCGNVSASGPNYVHFDESHRFLMVMTTAAWSLGSHTLDPDQIWVQVLDSSLLSTGASDSTGTLVIASAGTAVDDSSSRCRFTLSGVSLHGTGPAPQPSSLMARPGDLRLRD